MLAHKLRPTEDPALLFDPDELARRLRSRKTEGAFHQQQLAAHADTTPQWISSFATDKSVHMSIDVLAPITAFFFGEPDINVFIEKIPWDNARIARRMLEHSHVAPSAPEDRASVRARIDALFEARGHGAANDPGSADAAETGEVWVLAAYRMSSMGAQEFEAAKPEVQQILRLRRDPEALRRAGYEVTVFDPSPESASAPDRRRPILSPPTSADEEER